MIRCFCSKGPTSQYWFFYISYFLVSVTKYLKRSNLKQMLILAPGLKDTVYQSEEGVVVDNFAAAKGLACWHLNGPRSLYLFYELFNSFAHLLTGLFILLVFGDLSSLYIGYTNPPDIQMAATFPPPSGCFFTLLLSLLYRSFLISCHPASMPRSWNIFLVFSYRVSTFQLLH